MKLSLNSPVVLLFAIVSCIELFLAFVTGGATERFFVSPSGLTYTSITSWAGAVLHVVGHANFDHLLGNMMFILILGPILEEKYGSGLLLSMIIVTAIATALINAAIGDGGIIGASGIVFMMIVLASFANARSGTLPVTFVLVVFLYIGKELFAIFTPGNVSHLAHILGGCAGGAFGAVFVKK